MKLCVFKQGAAERLGAVVEGSVVDLNRAYAALLAHDGSPGGQALADARVPADVIAFLSAGYEARERGLRAVEFARAADAQTVTRDLFMFQWSEIKLLPPIPRPPKIICVARNYGAHAREAGREVSEIPILFPRFANTLVAEGAPVVRPTVSDEFDWEGELAVVIGKPGRHISQDEAMSYVAGYSLFNDVTVRDYQFRVQQYTAGKNFSASGPFGPCLVLDDEIPDPHDLEIVTRVNGEEMQRANTGDMIFKIPALIEHISEFIELEVGDVIPTGTPAGVGFTRQPPRFLRPGDTVSVEATGLGTLTNPVIAEEEA